MQCHVAVSQESNPQQAAQIVSRSVHEAFDEQTCHLACVFFSPHFSAELPSLIEIIHQHLAPQVLIGCMGAGVIGGTQEIEEHPGLVLWGLTNPSLTITPFHLTPKKDGEVISLDGWPVMPEGHQGSQTFLIFADPFSTPIDELFSLLADHSPSSVAIGGIASGGMDEGESRLILQDNVIESGVVGVALQGDMKIRTDSVTRLSTDWRTVCCDES